MPTPRRYRAPVGRRVDAAQLVGASEIAARLGAAGPHVVREWRRRYPGDFPDPVAGLVMGNVWLWPEVEAWARRTGRLPDDSTA